ncbi:glycosyl hydrolase [Nonomuraea sp. CA-143628]|uniref:glycosyl hydrolase n=1 Tax=Nonomuraea sp. CA-143628 TaxID=3239997 RepID=UPI003D943FF6
MTLDRDLFRSPTASDRPGMRWWWQAGTDPAELERELQAIADAGFGEVEIAFSPQLWATPDQRAALRRVLDLASLRGIGVAVTLGAEWPLRTPNTAAGTEHAALELQYGVVYVGHDHAGRIAIPSPIDEDELSRGARLLAVTVGRVVERGHPPAFVDVATFLGPRRELRSGDRATILAEDSLRDVTGRVVDGELDWAVPEGEWAVFAFWVRDTAQGVTSFIDAGAARAAAQYLQEHQLGQDNLAMLKGVGTDLFEDSLELNAESLFWAETLVERFRDRHGYDPTRFLPALFAHGMCRYWTPNEEPTPDFEFDTCNGGRVRKDYYRLLTDLYVDEHLAVFQDWARSLGMRHKSQAAYGQNLEPIRSNRELVRLGGHAEGESLNSGDRAAVHRDHPTWRFALDWQRCVVGGAHQGGTTRISTELGAQFAAAYRQTLGDLRQMLDKEWAAGITRPFVHGFASQDADAPWPTRSRFFDFVTESWNDRHYPEWAHWAPLTDYWARGTVVLETGIPRTDVAVYRDGFLTTAARGLPDDDLTAPRMLADSEALERAGYTVQFIDPVGLADTEAIESDGTLYPDGPGYRALIIDERRIDPAAIEAVVRAAANGLHVIFVGEAPAGDVGFSAREEGNERVRRAVDALRVCASVVSVGAADEAPAALKRLGLLPRAHTERADGGGVLTQWREGDGRDYILVYNPYDRPQEVRLGLEGLGVVTELDLDTGLVAPLACHSTDGRTAVELSLPALGLRVLELDRRSQTVSSPAPAPHGKGRVIPLTGWTLDVEAEEPTGVRRIALDSQGPADWRTVPGLEGVSGVGRYRAILPDSLPNGTYTLDLGGLAGSATVRVAGHTVATVYTSGVAVTIGERPEPATSIEIEVRTALINAVVAHGGHPAAGDVTAPHGLEGPVVLRSWASPDAAATEERPR